MAKGRVSGRGQGIARFRIPLLLIGFLLIALGVILRRSMGIAAGHELQQLDARRAALVAQRLRLEAEIRAASSRSRLQPIAEQRLNMHVPSDSQVVIITRAPAPTSAPPHDAP
ncbi:MAG: cell division protein FtsL [Gemmatimonadaceae bacterium]